MADSTCAEAAVVDTMFKYAIIGAIVSIAYTWAVNEGVIGKGFGSRAARYASGRVKGYFTRS